LSPPPPPRYIMEAHSGLSARIVQEAGFPGIWASGLSIAASMGVRDSNEASWSQVLEVVDAMQEASPALPILLDGDTGFGNFNNARRLVARLEKIRVAGLCLEDKLFPKANSLLSESVRQPLADIDEFVGKLKACKDAQRDPDFVLVARVEALIAGWGVDEALRRAEAYRSAGADAILIHSRQRHTAEIDAFCAEWAGRHPLIVVPTTYPCTPELCARWRVSLVIWAK
jgi:phosphoenolpyruvate phosphomutase